MTDEQEIEEQPELPAGVGETLRAAREANGLSLEELAARTRITQRHLALIESGDFAALPGRTYAIGFSRSYAKAVGLDEDEIARAVRSELSGLDMPGSSRSTVSFEPGDPGRVPSSRLAWISAIAALILFVGGSVFIWSSFIAPAGDLPWLSGGKPRPASSLAPARPAAVAPAPSGQVTFTALEPGIWVKFYDKDGRQLMQEQMGMGESYTVPADADGPMIWTGRPDALAITIGGQPVPKLSDQQVTVKNAPVSAAALLARASAPPPAATASPASAAPTLHKRPARSPGASSAAPSPTPSPAEPPPAASPTA